MKTYYFYCRTDKKKEAVAKTHASTESEAIMFFANQKKLSVEEFLVIYCVEAE